MLQYDVSRAFSVRYILFGAICMSIVGYVSQFDMVRDVLVKGEALEEGWIISFFSDLLYGKSVLFVFPILSSLPFASAFIDEWKSGMMRAAIGRVSKNEYLISKIITDAAAGAAMTAGAISMLGFISSLMFYPTEKDISFSVEFGWLMLRYILCGALYAQIGQFFSILLKHRYIAWLSPFMVYYLLVILHERYMEWCFIIYPPEWLQPKQIWGMGNWWLSIWLIVLNGVAGYGVYHVGKRGLSRV